MHGRKCKCGKYRVQSPLHVNVLGSDLFETHGVSECQSKPCQSAVTRRLVELTPEMLERAERIGQHENKTVEQVVHDAMTISWVRHATKYGW